MRKIYIRRKEVQGYLPKEIRAAARVTLGSMYVGRQPLKGLDGEEAKKLLPNIIGVPADHADFPALEKKFWADMSVKIPFEGKELNITVTESGEPEEALDYVTYKWASKHRHVADSKEQMDASKKFYIYDPQKALLKKNVEIKVRREADKEFIKMTGNLEKMRRVLRVLTQTNPDKLSEIEVENSLYEAKSKKPKKFLKVVTDKNLDLRAEIEKLVTANIIRKIGNQHIYGEETIGENITDTIIYFKNKKNSGAVNSIRAELKAIT
tara:strand:+ start:12784 stop:13581 length:798 start_codon:yes stop_codon:yes gene_type:complete